jgi:hypothetical protein
MRRTALSLALPFLLVASLVACGDDDSSSDDTTTTTSAQDAYCADADQLKTDIASTKDMDVVSDGTDAVSSQLDTLKADLSSLKSSAGDLASPEIDTFQTSLDDLESALSAVSGDLTAANAADVVPSRAGRGHLRRRGGHDGRGRLLAESLVSKAAAHCDHKPAPASAGRSFTRH